MELVTQEAPRLAPSVPTSAAPGRPALRTWHMFAAAVVLTAALMWINQNWVMTRDVYHNLLSDQMEAGRIDEYFDVLHQSARWGYVSLPLVVALRVGLVAALLQLFCLFFLAEAPIAKLFRAALWAYPALLYGVAVRLLVLARTAPEEITRDALSVTPGSLTALFPRLGEPGTPLYAGLSLVSFWEVLWCAALFLALRRVAGVRGWWTRAAAVGGVWTLLALFQWGITVYLTGVK
jgi:hypothetical protein